MGIVGVCISRQNPIPVLESLVLTVEISTNGHSGVDSWPRGSATNHGIWRLLNQVQR